ASVLFRLEELLDPEGVQARDEAKIREHEEGLREAGVHSLPGPVRVGRDHRGRYP
ncbi:MAG: hypothetical protein H0U15_10510, partial [Geodermatophilaceae bacterium]|nr:hypothetical protein [Geodermatophilaceae bacterium]